MLDARHDRGQVNDCSFVYIARALRNVDSLICLLVMTTAAFLPQEFSRVCERSDGHTQNILRAPDTDSDNVDTTSWLAADLVLDCMC